MKTISIINLKGGVGKTLTSIALAYILSVIHGQRVLLIDNDKQGDASRGLRRRSKDKPGIEILLTTKHPDVRRIVRKTKYKNLDIITANMKLYRAIMEIQTDTVRERHTHLKEALESVQGDYDWCIIDNAPDINMSTINALVASDDVIVPVELDDNSTEGLDEVIRQVREAKQLNSGLNLAGCLITKFDASNPAHVQGETLLRSLVQSRGCKVFESKIRVSKKVSESTFARQPINEYSARSAAAIAYKKFAQEYLEECDRIGHKSEV